jgi:hypothetical protein
MEVCMVVRYTRVEKVMVVLILVGVDGMVADTVKVKLKILAEMALPLLLDYSNRSGEVGE